MTKDQIYKILDTYLQENIVLVEAKKIIYTNAHYKKTFNLNHNELNFTNEKESLRFEEHILNAINNKKSQTQIEMLMTNKNNANILFNIKTKIILHEEKQLLLHVIQNSTKQNKEKLKLNNLANIDKLTGIYNRRYFDEILISECNRAKRYKRKLSAIYFDIDYFKKINDNYGHDVGDIVLSDMSTIIKDHIRENDIFARWGGEEFILLLPETSKKDAAIFAENLRKHVFEYKFKHVNQISISLGVSEFYEKERIRTFLKRLDTALYQAKSEGRNKSILLSRKLDEEI